MLAVCASLLTLLRIGRLEALEHLQELGKHVGLEWTVRQSDLQTVEHLVHMSFGARSDLLGNCAGVIVIPLRTAWIDVML